MLNTSTQRQEMLTSPATYLAASLDLWSSPPNALCFENIPQREIGFNGFRGLNDD